jgi:hypothetical protein
MITIGTVISYCTLDHRFIRFCVESVKPFSSQIIIVSADHFFDGTSEDIELLNKTHEEISDSMVDKIIYKWKSDLPHYWHNMSRWVGLENLKDNIEYVFFLDADEIMDSASFKIWLLNENLFRQFNAFTFYCYWYFREARYRAKTLENAGLLINRKWLTRENMFTRNERMGILQAIPNAAIANGVALAPMLHHYSWVRTKEEMLRKVKAWGHRNDTDWVKLIEEEFTHEFNGTDFLPGHHYQYEIVEPVHDIKL